MAKYLIVGGVAGGATTAARLRRIDENAQIIMFERGEYISYANCGLPYYLGGVISERDKLFVQTPEKFKETLNVEVRNFSEVQSIDRAAKTVTVQNLQTGKTYSESYDKLVLSPGAEPVKPPITGIQSERIFTVRNVKDTDAIKDFMDRKQPKRAIVVGGGFIGLEMAENLHHKGIQVSIVEMAAQVMVMLDYEMAAEVHQHFKMKGVECYLQDGVQSFSTLNDKVQMKLNTGRTLEADMVILSIGVRPDSGLAMAAGIEVGQTKGIKVNEYLQTSDPFIYAVGDAIEFIHPITKKPVITYLAGPANKQGRICADNLVFGNKSVYKGAIGTAVAKVFDLTVGSTGASEKMLHKEGIPFLTCVTHGSSHAGYYPGAMAMTLKLVFAPETGLLFGAQIVGYEGVDKRIDVIAALIRMGGTVHDLTEFEQAYAPPYSSAKDPVNILGFVAQNILEGRTRHIRWDELKAADPHHTCLIDVRTQDEFAMGTLEGAIHIPQHELRERLNEVPRTKKVVVFCGVGLRAYMAEQILRQNGFTDVWNLSGGYKTYMHAVDKQSNEDIFSGDFIGRDSQIYQANVEGGSSWTNASKISVKTLEVDACGLQCPGPVMKLKKEMDKASPGQRFTITATDPGFFKDVGSWCRMTGNTLVDLKEEKGRVTAVVEKALSVAHATPTTGPLRRDTTLVVFSDAMDKALASLVIANGSASAGKTTTLFFTFWGLNILKKRKKPRGIKKDLMGRMFGMMMPKHLDQLHLSKMSMGGMGDWMMKLRMKALGIDALQTMLQNAKEAGVRLVACQMSMDVMGVKAEEFIDGVEIGGVATFLEASDTAATTLFI